MILSTTTTSIQFYLLALTFGQVCWGQSLNNNNQTSENDDESGVCQQLSNDDSSKRLKILCVGLLPVTILLITENFDIFELKLDSLQNTINQLYIQAKPEKLKDRWPTLYNNYMFQKIIGKIYNAFTVTNDDGQYVLFTVKQSIYPKLQGVTYDLVRDKVHLGLYYKNKDDQVLLSTDTKLTFYALHEKNGGLEIATYRFDGEQVVGDETNIDRTSDWHSLCIRPDRTIYVDSGDTTTDNNGKNIATCKKVDWPVLKGFVFDANFYLFGSDFVFVFDQSVYTDGSNSRSKVRKISYNGFIKCGGNLRKLGDNSKNHTLLGIIIAVVLFILLFCLLLVLCIRKRINDEKNKKKNKKKSSTETKKNHNTNKKENKKGGPVEPIVVLESVTAGGAAGGSAQSNSQTAMISNRSSASQLPKLGLLSSSKSNTNKHNLNRANGAPPTARVESIEKSKSSSKLQLSTSNSRSRLAKQGGGGGGSSSSSVSGRKARAQADEQQGPRPGPGPETGASTAPAAVSSFSQMISNRSTASQLPKLGLLSGNNNNSRAQQQSKVGGATSKVTGAAVSSVKGGGGQGGQSVFGHNVSQAATGRSGMSYQN